MRSLSLTLFDSLSDVKGRPEHWTVDEFGSLITKHSIRENKDGPCIFLGKLRPGGHRRKGDVEFYEVLAIDLDHNFDLEVLIEIWSEYRYFLVSTHSNTIESPRLRAYFPLIHSVPAADWHPFAKNATACLSRGMGDPCGADQARVWLLPSCPKRSQSDVIVRINDGRLLDPSEFSFETEAPIVDRIKIDLSWEDILSEANWTITCQSNQGIRWAKPGRPGETHATTGYMGDNLYVFSTNAPPFKPRRTYSKIDAYALLHCNGNLELARKAIGSETFKKGSQAKDKLAHQRVIEIGHGLNITYFKNQDGEIFGFFIRDGKPQFIALEGADFKSLLLKIYYQEYSNHPGNDAIGRAIDVLKINGMDLKSVNFPVRIQDSGESIYFDLANDAGEVIEIDKEGWRIMQNPGIPFISNQSKKAMPLPVRDSGVSIWDLQKFLNLKDDEVIVVASLLVGWFFTSTAIPILVIQGEQGSAKSTTAKLICDLIDPSCIQGISTKDDERELMALFDIMQVFFFDNISSISDRLSDILCKFSTGGALYTRALYTNKGTSLATGRRSVVITTILSAVKNPDLQSRCITLMLKSIDHGYRTEREIMDKFDRLRPAMLCILFDAVSSALRLRGSIEIRQTVRLADFYRHAAAAAPAFGLEMEEVLRALDKNARDGQSAAADSNMFCNLVCELVSQEGNVEGTATELSAKLNGLTTDQRFKVFPNRFSDLARKFKPLLTARDVEIVEQPRKSDRRSYLIRKIEESAVMPSSSAQFQHDRSDDSTELVSPPDEQYDPFDDDSE